MPGDNAADHKAVILEWATKGMQKGPDRWKDFAPDFRWRVIGSTPMSGLMVGSEGIDHGVSGFRERIERLEVIIDALICEGDTVAKFAHSEGLTKDGQPYRNEVATLFRFENGTIVDVVEYFDTALVETVIFGKSLVEASN